MKTLTLAATAVTLALLISPAAIAQNRNDGGRAGEYAGQQDPRQHGYEHGYRDGADRARQDRERGVAYNFRDNDYLQGERDYDRSFGSKREYMSGYQEGFKSGYDDGYRDRGGRYGELYQRPGGGDRGRGSDSGAGPGRGNSSDAAFDSGYREGIAAGQQDQRQNARSNFRRSDSYRRGDADFQDGFERGYQDGYGRTRYSTDGGGYFPNQDRKGAADTRDGAGPQTRSISVPANRQWTPTSIRVSQGDRITLQTTGEIKWTPVGDGRAQSAGSLDRRTTPNAPIPSAFAGALIGRIDSGQPFGIGNQTSIVAPASGLLYLGINDDIVTDNSGQFQVNISW